MSQQVEECIKEAAEGFADIPDDFSDMGIKDSIPESQDWDQFNTRLCQALKEKGCRMLESQLDRHWKNNKTFGEMIHYIDDRCTFNG